jgi:hypothetical protein
VTRRAPSGVGCMCRRCRVERKRGASLRDTRRARHELGWEPQISADSCARVSSRREWVRERAPSYKEEASGDIQHS